MFLLSFLLIPIVAAILLLFIQQEKRRYPNSIAHKKDHSFEWSFFI